MLFSYSGYCDGYRHILDLRLHVSQQCVPGPEDSIPPSHFLTLTSSPASLGMCWQLSVLPRLRRLSFHTTDVTTLSQVVAVLVYGIHLFLTVTRGNEEGAKEKQINHADSGCDLWFMGHGWFTMLNPNPCILIRFESGKKGTYMRTHKILFRASYLVSRRRASVAPNYVQQSRGWWHKRGFDEEGSWRSSR